MNAMQRRPYTALLLCAAMLIVMPARAASDQTGVEDKSIELEAQASALEADADQQCAKQPKHARQSCHAQIGRAVQRLRAKAALAR